MSNKIIGIKQADGSFFPILNDGSPNKKTLELTTVKDGQTTVKVNLYKQYEDKDDLEYVDTLLIQNLVPHKKEEPSFNLSIGVDEEGVLSAEVVDPETGAKSDTTVSLVTLSEAQLGETSDFGFVSDGSSYEFGTTEFTNPEDKAPLDESDALDVEEALINDDEELQVEDQEDDSFSLDNLIIAPVNLDLGDDLSEDSETDLPDGNSENDFSFEETSLEDLLVSADGEETGDFVFDESLPEEIEDDALSLDDLTESADIDLTEDLDTTESNEELTLEEDFGLENIENETSLSLDDDSLISDDIGDIGLDLDDTTDLFSSEGLNDDLGFSDTETEIQGNDDFDFEEDLDDSSDPFSVTDTSDEMSLTDDFEMDFENNSFDSEITTSEDSFNFGSIDTDFDTDTSEDSTVFNEESTDEIDMSLNMDDDFDFNTEMDNSSTEDSDSISFDDDEIDMSSMSGFDDNFETDSNLDTDFNSDTVQYAEFGKQDTYVKNEEPVNPPLFDKKLNEDMAKRQTKNKYPLSTLISIICAIICIIAVIVCFILFAWPSDNSKYTNENIVHVEPPVVFEKEQLEEKEEGAVTTPPKTEENKIEIVEKEEVIPVKPPVPETAVTQNLKYRLIWGDTLWDISDTFYRNPWLYNTIADENNIKNPDHIVAGTDIYIPLR